MGTKTDKLLAKGKEIILAEGVLLVKPLSCKVLFSISDELSKGVAQLIAGFRGRKEGSTEITPENIMTILNFAPSLLALFDRAVDKPMGFCLDLSLDDLSEVILATLEVNDFERVVKNFKAASQMYLKTKTVSVKPSPTS